MLNCTDKNYAADLFDFSKALQGVKDKNPKPIPAFVSLQWQVPSGTPENIPDRHLSPQWSPETYVVSTKFPPDDRSYGWERGTTVSKAWDLAATDAALDAAEFVSQRINELAKTNDKEKYPPQEHEDVRRHMSQDLAHWRDAVTRRKRQGDRCAAGGYHPDRAAEGSHHRVRKEHRQEQR